MDLPRVAGVLLHISSLPGKFGAGDLGVGARNFVDFLAESSQSYWQVLPLGPTCGVFADSPYMSFSAFAGNPLFIDLADLAEQGLVPPRLLAGVPDFSEYLVDYDGATSWRAPLLDEAWLAFKTAPPGEFGVFCASHPWLEDYALFMALRERQGGQPWCSWPRELAGRDPGAMVVAREQLADRIGYHCFLQFQFFRQWQRLRQYAQDRKVQFVGDLPIYVGHDSADVWAHPEFFCLRSDDFQPSQVAGVPPDYFSATGQRWGNPVYRWESAPGVVNRPLYDWWAMRLGALFAMTDLCRIDHFRGFEAYWAIAVEEETAVHGRWLKGPGAPFFAAMRAALGEMPFIAEDLGVITPAVDELRRGLGLPGMKVLQFAFDGDEKNLYLPHNFSSTNCVVYTGTHDNNTTLGWYLDAATDDKVRSQLHRYLNCDGKAISHDLVRCALASVARVAITPLQDILGFGGDCRLNTPGTSQGNWRWRCAPRFLTAETAKWLRDETLFYNRGGERYCPENQVPADE
ncbi:MAG: 4-alpha-glucanotransferase [Desulfobulbaceae bacterium]|nr:4-alpha-glucanotransferase [Desulfobulbaceae bacterium]